MVVDLAFSRFEDFLQFLVIDLQRIIKDRVQCAKGIIQRLFLTRRPHLTLRQLRLFMLRTNLIFQVQLLRLWARLHFHFELLILLHLLDLERLMLTTLLDGG